MDERDKKIIVKSHRYCIVYETMLHLRAEVVVELFIVEVFCIEAGSGGRGGLTVHRLGAFKKRPTIQIETFYI